MREVLYLPNPSCVITSCFILKFVSCCLIVSLVSVCLFVRCQRISLYSSSSLEVKPRFALMPCDTKPFIMSFISFIIFSLLRDFFFALHH